MYYIRIYCLLTWLKVFVLNCVCKIYVKLKKLFIIINTKWFELYIILVIQLVPMFSIIRRGLTFSNKFGDITIDAYLP